MKKIGSKPATQGGAAESGVDKQTLDELYKIRDEFNQEIKKSTEKFESATSKMNFRIEHLKKNLVELMDENDRLKKENEELKSKN